MLAQILFDTATIAAPSISMAFAGWQANTYYRRKRERAEEKVKGLTLAEVMQKGNEIVAQMAADVQKLYHPPGEDGEPCACAYCEITADDEPANMVDKTIKGTAQEWTAEDATNAYNVSPAYVKALQDKINGLRKENTELRKGSGQRVVTKVQERKTPLQNKIEEAMRFTSEGDIRLTLEPSDMTNGHPMQIIIGQQAEPDHIIVKHGGEVVRKIYDRPQSGPGSKELGIMDRQLGTIGRDCENCGGDKAWVIVGGRHICKKCYYSMGTNECHTIPG